MKVEAFSFGKIRVDGKDYEHDIIINRGSISKRDKNPSKELRQEYGHTPLTIDEDIPWKCRRLVIGTGAYGSLPVLDEVKSEAEERGIELILLPTSEAAKIINECRADTNAILHVTC